MANPKPLRVVLDTNVVLSALVFGGGRWQDLRDAWQAGRCLPLVSSATASELIRVLTYPKFGLTAGEQEDLLADYLPFCITVQTPRSLPRIPECRDPFDRPFLELAVFGKARYLVTGDRDLLSIASEFSCAIVGITSFLDTLPPAG